MENKVWMYAEDIENIDFKVYQRLALRTASSLSSSNLILNGVLGIAGEGGEVADIVKKNLFQGHELDKDKLVDELGDVMWYIAIMAEGLGVSLEEIARHNILKLLKRYPNGFEATRSVNRDE